MTEVVGVSATPASAPNFRVRLLLPRNALAARGVRLEPLSLFPPDGLEARGLLRSRAGSLLHARRRLEKALSTSVAEATVISRQADVLPFLALERRAMAGRRFVYDVDDSIWLDAREEARGGRLAVLKGSARKAAWLAQRAETVIAGNPILAEWLSRHSRNVTVVPSLVETHRIPVRRHADDGEVVLGWIGSRTTATYLGALRDILTAAAHALAPVRLRLIVVGGSLDAVPGVAIETHPWSEGAELAVLRQMDIGLMPLPDNPWTRGKCGYKAIQYMAAGVPVVADDVGITGELLDRGNTGVIARGSRAWIDALVGLGRSPEARARLGSAGRSRAESHYSVANWAPVLSRVLQGAS
jgi:glycosyltransferase involved in cell wall biosynthesis